MENIEAPGLCAGETVAELNGASLIYHEKRGETAAAYPRPWGQIRKTPL